MRAGDAMIERCKRMMSGQSSVRVFTFSLRPSGGGQSQKQQKPPAKPTSPSRKRKRRTSQRENTELQTDVSDEPLTPAVSRDSECNGGPGSAVANNCEEGASNHLEASCCHRDTGGCHGNSPKRRKLKHSSYSITMEEEELQLREAAVTKVTIALCL